MDINLDKYIHADYGKLVFEKINEIGFKKLKPLKESLPDEVSYFDIKYYVIKYKLLNCLL